MNELASESIDAVVSDDALFAAWLAEAAGRVLLDVRAAGGEPRELGKRGDAESNAFLLAALNAHRPGDAVLSEESADDPARLAADRVWIIDPLDGTREFGLAGRADWAVHVALWQAEVGITAAAVAQPARGAVHCTADTTEPVAAHGVPRILVSDSRPPTFAGAVVSAVDGALVPMGSAGAKTMAVLRGDAEAYIHGGGQWEWDSAAPAGVALAAGLHASRVDGTPLRYNQPHPYLPDLVICRKELSGRILAAIGTG